VRIGIGRCAGAAVPLNHVGRFVLLDGKIMRAETVNIVEEIKQSVGLLRRHL